MIEDSTSNENRSKNRSFAQTLKNGPMNSHTEGEDLDSAIDTGKREAEGDKTDMVSDSESDIRVEKIEEGLFNIVISEETERKLWKSWWNTLIVKLLGRKVGYAEMKRRLEIMWSNKGSLDVIDLGQDFYLVKFYANEDFDFALLEGPWKLYDHYLTVRLWEPNFNPQTATIDKVTAWIRPPGLPIKLYDRNILRKIENIIGRTVKVDSNTAELCRGKFARLCVEVDLTKPLIGRYLINGREYRVEYEGIHQICFSCGRIDHEQKDCPLKQAPKATEAQSTQDFSKNQRSNGVAEMEQEQEEQRRLDKGK
ncbi:uncharacterized protein LOC127740571 [Arachis duranensis]|uniref:Uncharacterized protein LOC127740571 n=1 Tax=Arachis duranensis TaxID=130453 RepID=A0A9C6T0K3_ARADU|nr:uncharacterized protein LOC112703465 [Arachis hypogaea]XP_025610702.1 uncharacterized protein LOC112703465 [Arachis hypogaea]XP_052107591.1 uncharacterized protein LOC127740571 [Arachis duranensis]QHO28903.1 uncharacterized protein DS421_7g220710 [Arachis hypogaea]